MDSPPEKSDISGILLLVVSLGPKPKRLYWNHPEPLLRVRSEIPTSGHPASRVTRCFAVNPRSLRIVVEAWCAL